MTQEVRAAIDGARDARRRATCSSTTRTGTCAISYGTNCRSDERLRVITGTRKPWSMGQGLDAQFRRRVLHRISRQGGRRGDAFAHFQPRDDLRRARQRHACSEALLIAGAGRQLRRAGRADHRRPREPSTRRCAAMPWCVGVAVKDAVGFSAVELADAERRAGGHSRPARARRSLASRAPSRSSSRRRSNSSSRRSTLRMPTSSN